MNAACSIVDVKDYVKDDEKVSKAIRRSNTTSMGRAISSVASGESDAIVSGGNSGALMALSILFVKRISGINRQAMADLMPTKIV